MVCRIALAFIVSVALVGVVWGIETEEAVYIYNMDQNVVGTGFFNAYKNTIAGNLAMENKGHGSGSLDCDAKLHTEKEYTYNSAAMDYESTSDKKIVFNESMDFAYGVSQWQVGKSFRSDAYRSLGMEKTCIKNYPEISKDGVSMMASFDSLDTLSKDITVDLYHHQVSGTDDPHGGDPFEKSFEEKGQSILNVDAAFTGRGHIGALAVNGSMHNVQKMIDEDYIGTFSIVKKISHEYDYIMKAEREDWLPCCFGGWNDMNYRDQKGFGKSAKGVFDCTCAGF